MTRFILLLEYDGSGYAGFQYQPDAPSIQNELEKVLNRMYGQALRVIPSGRTDAGVHACGQVLHFDAPKQLKNLNLKAALNSQLPSDIRVLDYTEKSTEFHARYSAKERRYRYLITQRETALDRKRMWQIFEPLDLDAMQECARILNGEHDFTSFCSAQAEVNHKRCMIYHAGWKREDTVLRFDIHGNRFLHNMVRSLVGTMAEVGRKRLDVQDFRQILAAEDRLAGAVTAPPQGLYLTEVIYKELLPWEKETK